MIWYLTRPIFSNYKFYMKSNLTLNITLYLVSTDLDIFESIIEKRSNRRSNICVFVGARFICLLKVLKIVWSFWNEWVGVNQLVISQFLKFMEVIMEIIDLRSQIVFLIRIDDDIKMLHAKFQPSMTILRTKCNLHKMWCHKA